MPGGKRPRRKEGEKMGNIAEAYDFSLFEQREEVPVRRPKVRRVAPVGNTVPAERPVSVPRQQPKKKVVRLPQEELERNRRPRRNPLKSVMSFACFFAIVLTVASLINAQVQLVELSKDIETQSASLAAAQEAYVQMEMKTMNAINDMDVETYAKTELGMTKVTQQQVKYLGMNEGDKGEVLMEAKAPFWERIMTGFQSLFAS